mgnify:CR=1 FL=1
MQPEIAPPKIEDGGPPLDDEKGSGAQAVERILKLTRDVSAPPFLAGAFAGSSFLLGIAERRPDLLSSALTGNPQIQFEKALTNAAAEAQAAGSVRDLMRALRRSKEEVAFLAAMFDLSGIWPLEAVMTNLSTAADRFVSLAVRFLLARAAEAGQFRPADPGSPEKDSGLIVLGMGKLGAEELNYSSDIDLIIFFDRSRAPWPVAISWPFWTMTMS